MGWGGENIQIPKISYKLSWTATTPQVQIKFSNTRDLLHLGQSSLAVIERNNLPKRSLAAKSRNLAAAGSVSCCAGKSEICVESQQWPTVACNRGQKHNGAFFVKYTM